jgi:uncharacterized heparinase superfamily protein
LTPDGARLDGEDAFSRIGAGEGPVPVAVRFHLAPSVRPALAEDGARAALVLPNGEAWQFWGEGAAPTIEDSVFFAASEGARRTQQIVLAFDAAKTPRVAWRFERLR